MRETLQRHRLDGLIAIGGEDTLGVGATACSQDGVNVVGVPKTIDNDLGATDVTFGFDTALQIATEAIDRLHTTAESHNRILVVEVMGRNAGWIALHSGIAGGADVILIPEVPFDIDEVCRADQAPPRARPRISRSWSSPRARRRRRARCDVAAGEIDEFGHPRLGGIGHALERRDRGAHGLRDAGDGARPHPARRHADRVRPRARDPARDWRRSTPRTRRSGG